MVTLTEKYRIARQKFWTKAFLTKVKQEKDFSLAINYADLALAEFDKRFKQRESHVSTCYD